MPEFFFSRFCYYHGLFLATREKPPPPPPFFLKVRGINQWHRGKWWILRLLMSSDQAWMPGRKVCFSPMQVTQLDAAGS